MTEVTFIEKPQLKIISFQLNYTCSNKGFKGTVVNRTFSFLNESLLEITLSDPIFKWYFDLVVFLNSKIRKI